MPPALALPSLPRLQSVDWGFMEKSQQEPVVPGCLEPPASSPLTTNLAVFEKKKKRSHHDCYTSQHTSSKTPRDQKNEYDHHQICRPLVSSCSWERLQHLRISLPLPGHAWLIAGPMRYAPPHPSFSPTQSTPACSCPLCCPHAAQHVAMLEASASGPISAAGREGWGQNSDKALLVVVVVVV